MENRAIDLARPILVVIFDDQHKTQVLTRKYRAFKSSDSLSSRRQSSTSSRYTPGPTHNNIRNGATYPDPAMASAASAATQPMTPSRHWVHGSDTLLDDELRGLRALLQHVEVDNKKKLKAMERDVKKKDKEIKSLRAKSELYLLNHYRY